MEASPLLGQFTWVSQAEIPFFWGVELFPASIWGLPGYWLDSKLLATVLPSLWFITETIIMAKISILFAQFFCGHSTFMINLVRPCKAGRPDSLCYSVCYEDRSSEQPRAALHLSAINIWCW